MSSIIDNIKHNLLFYTIVLLIIGISLRLYFTSEEYNLKCIVSSLDGNKYCVRERQHKEEAVDLLAKVTQKCKDLVDYMEQSHKDDESVKRLVKGFNPKKIIETLPNSELTAYSENKGEKIAFCLNKKKNGTKLIDIDTLTFVAIHELSHIMTKSVGHKQEFWNNFKFLLENAKKANIYIPVDYKKEPQDYCGMTITDNPYYDI
jgi:hypothetical protein